MHTPNEIYAWLKLVETQGVGSVTLYKLLATFGLPEEILAASYGQLCKVVSDNIARNILNSPDKTFKTKLEHTLSWLEQPNHHLLSLSDKTYPASLLEIADPPPLLYAVGDLNLLNQSAIAIVGSRNASLQGCLDAKQFAHQLANQHYTIVSGMALGIDTNAHIGALESNIGSTIAVIGTGADRIYPARNKKLAHDIAQRGLLLTEFSLGTAAISHNFPRRNRIIAGLSQAILVVEAALESGSLITARLAAEQGRDVFAMPGSIHSPLSKGCHQLIKQGAKLVDCVEDILQDIRYKTSTPLNSETIITNNTTADTTSKKTPPNTQTFDDPLKDYLGFDPVDIDTLGTRSQLDAATLNNLLLTLEIEGKIEKMPGNRYRRLA